MPLCLVLASTVAAAQKKIACTDGEHIEIDIKQISMQYDASSFAGTLSSLSVLRARLEVAPKRLQEAAVATQQWNELLKGLAAGYNSCAITRQQYADGLNRIYPRLKEDATGLEEIRKEISAGRKADAKRLQQLIDSFYSNLRQFAQVSGTEKILDRIEALSDQVTTSEQEILKQQKADTASIQEQQKTDTDRILARFDELKEKEKRSPLPTPTEVGKQVSELRKTLLAKADEAEAAYNTGYDLLDRYRFHEAIPYLQRAVASVPLPDFYLTLGRAYSELPDLNSAEKVLREGLALPSLDEQHLAQLANQLGVVLRDKGDLDGALSYTKRALEIDEKVYGPDHATAATFAGNIGTILLAKGDPDGALSYSLQALNIQEKVYGADHHDEAIDSNIGAILLAKGDLDGALTYSLRALKIQERVYGTDHPRVATDSNNIGVILLAKGDLDGALSYAQRALQIDEKVYGPDYPSVAMNANNIGQILLAKGDLDGALSYARRALQILEKSFGPDNPLTKRAARNLEEIERAIQLKAKSRK